MKLHLKRCPVCLRTGIVRKKVDRTYEVGGVRRIVRAVDVQVCRHCGETFLDLAAADFVDRSLGLKGKRRRARRAA